MSGEHSRATLWNSKVAPWLLLPLVGFVLVFLALVPMTWQEQSFFGVVLVFLDSVGIPA